MASTIKTAISIRKSLFEEAENLAQELNVSRSELFGLAIETFVRSHQNQKLLEEINQAYSDEPDPSEKVRLNKMRKHHRNRVRNTW
jgi:metal-responsive CopG/Arc/MetJ family transcriptional regulator